MEIFQKGKYHCTVKKKKENLYKFNIIIRTIWRKILNIFEPSKKKKKHLRMQHYSVPKVSHSAKKQFNPSMGNHWTIKEKKNINIPDFSPVDFAFSPRRW